MLSKYKGIFVAISNRFKVNCNTESLSAVIAQVIPCTYDQKNFYKKLADFGVDDAVKISQFFQVLPTLYENYTLDKFCRLIDQRISNLNVGDLAKRLTDGNVPIVEEALGYQI